MPHYGKLLLVVHVKLGDNVESLKYNYWASAINVRLLVVILNHTVVS